MQHDMNSGWQVFDWLISERHPTPEITKYEILNWEELHFEWQYENKSRTLETKFKGWFKDRFDFSGFHHLVLKFGYVYTIKWLS